MKHQFMTDLLVISVIKFEKYWDFIRIIRDVISLKISEIFKEAANIVPTKRNILSIIARVYDPTGYLQPLVIMLKIIFQEIMQVKYKMG